VPDAAAEKPSPKKTTTYLQRSRFPVYSLALVLPMLLFYEIGIVFVHRAMQARYGYRWSDTSDWLIRRFMGGILEALGRNGFFMSGVLIAAVLVVWQIASRRSWEVRLGTLVGMLAECAVLALVLAAAVVLLLDPLLVPEQMKKPEASVYEGVTFAEMVFRVGSGVYEEFVFRFVGVGVIALVVSGAFGLKWKAGLAVGVLISALLFSGVHFVGADARAFTAVSFISRAFSGVLFGVIFVTRGFGVAAGTHVMYNLLCEVFYTLLV